MNEICTPFFIMKVFSYRIDQSTSEGNDSDIPGASSKTDDFIESINAIPVVEEDFISNNASMEDKELQELVFQSQIAVEVKDEGQDNYDSLDIPMEHSSSVPLSPMFQSPKAELHSSDEEEERYNENIELAISPLLSRGNISPSGTDHITSVSDLDVDVKVGSVTIPIAEDNEDDISDDSDSSSISRNLDNHNSEHSSHSDHLNSIITNELSCPSSDVELFDSDHSHPNADFERKTNYISDLESMDDVASDHLHLPIQSEDENGNDDHEHEHEHDDGDNTS